MLHHLLLLSSHLLLWHHLHAGGHVPGDHLMRRELLHLLGWQLLRGDLGHGKWLFKHVNVAWVLHIVEKDAYLGFTNAFRLQKVLHRIQVKAHLTSLLHELFSFLHEIGWNLVRLIGSWPH